MKLNSLQDLKKVQKELQAAHERSAAEAAARAAEAKNREAERNLFAKAVGVVKPLPDRQHAKLPKTPAEPVARQFQQDEAAALRERIPEWRDPEKFQAGSQELRNYLINQGANPYDVDTLSSSLAVSIARKAMLYDKLRADKAAKSKQVRNAPPVVKPGAANADSGKTNFAKAKQEIRRMGQRGQNKAQEKLMEGLLSRVFK